MKDSSDDFYPTVNIYYPCKIEVLPTKTPNEKVNDLTTQLTSQKNKDEKLQSEIDLLTSKLATSDKKVEKLNAEILTKDTKLD